MKKWYQDIFLPFTFWIQSFLICLFHCQKPAFVFECQHTSMWKIKIFSRFYMSYEGKNCVDIYPIHLGTRIWRPSIHIYLKKWFFWPSKHCCPFYKGEKLLSQLWTVWSHKWWRVSILDSVYMCMYKLGTRSYGYIPQNTSQIANLHLALKEGQFWW